MKTKTLIGLALLVTAIHGGGCGKEPYIGGDIDELALKETPWHVADARAAVSNGIYPSMSAAYGETFTGPRRQSEPAPLKSNSLTKWWKRIWQKIKAALSGDDDDPPDDPVTPPIVPPVTPPVTPPAEVGDNTFLWKPVSDSRGGRACAIFPCSLAVASCTINGSATEATEAPQRANGNRVHLFLRKTGSDYGGPVEVVCFDASRKRLRAWTVPNGGDRWGAN